MKGWTIMLKAVELFVPTGRDVFEYIQEKVEKSILKWSWIYIEKSLVEYDQRFKRTSLGNKVSDLRGIKLDNEKANFYSVQEWLKEDYNIFRVIFPNAIILVKNQD